VELVNAPVADLRALLTQSFEEWAAKGRSCALSGDATALIFLPALRAANVNWSRITLFWTDEHAVPADDPESNYGIAERMLLSPLGAKAPRGLRMPSELPLLEAAERYDATLEAELHNNALDLAILGAGEDGHVAALFAHSAQDRPATPVHPPLRVVAVENAPRPPRRRLSLTLEFLLRTKQIWIVAIGARKLPVVHAALSRAQSSTPLDAIVQRHRDVTVFTDQVIRRR
jgi:6-phosphogluconolactonase